MNGQPRRLKVLLLILLPLTCSACAAFWSNRLATNATDVRTYPLSKYQGWLELVLRRGHDHSNGTIHVPRIIYDKHSDAPNLSSIVAIYV